MQVCKITQLVDRIRRANHIKAPFKAQINGLKGQIAQMRSEKQDLKIRDKMFASTNSTVE